MSFVKKINTAP